MTYLEYVEHARWEREEAYGAYVVAIRHAIEAGESKTAVAQAAGISRPTLYKLLKESE